MDRAGGEADGLCEGDPALRGLRSRSRDATPQRSREATQRTVDESGGVAPSSRHVSRQKTRAVRSEHAAASVISAGENASAVA